MKLIQLNIWQGRLIRQIVDFLQKEQADFMCLQEIYSGSYTNPAYDFLCSLEKIQSVFPDYHTYFSPTYEMYLVDKPFKFGNAILSRYPLLNTETIFINGDYISYRSFDEYKPDVKFQRRNLQRAMAQIGDNNLLCLINHHGYWELSPLGSGTTIRKMQKVAEVIKNSPQPILFAGDLNILPQSSAMKPVQELLHDLTAEYRLPTTLSELGKVPNVACDHICASDDIKVNSFKASDTLLSDHKALILEFEMPSRVQK